MEDEGGLVGIGPLYFFDQMKTKRKKWEKRVHISHMKYISEDMQSLPENIQPQELEKEVGKSLEAAQKKKYAFQSFAISLTPIISKFPIDFKFSKVHIQKSPFEENKYAAAELLCELGETLQMYAEKNIALPVGIVNLVNYSWLDLIEETYKHSKKSKKQDVLQSTLSSTTVDKVSSTGIECPKDSYLMKGKKDHFGPINSMEKTCWIFHYPYSKLEILKWKRVLDIAVKKLQEVIIQIKAEKARLKKEGFNKQLILRHYNDPKNEGVVNTPFGSQYFWLELLKGKAQIPAVQKDNPRKRKFHYALIDGSSIIYYPSGRIAICQSYSALPWGGMYTNIFSDLPDQVVLGTFTPFGCGSISFPKGNPMVRSNSHLKKPRFKEHVYLYQGPIIEKNIGWLLHSYSLSVELWAPPLCQKNPFYTVNCSCPIKCLIISMMFNEDGGLVINKNGYVVREWAWPSKGRLDDPVEILVNAFITVKISGRFAISLVYKRHSESLTLSLAPIKRKSKLTPHSPETPFPDVNPISKEAKELFKAYEVKCKLMKSINRVTYPSNLSGLADPATFETIMNISPMSDVATVKLRRLQRKARGILFNWLDYYRFSLGMECLHMFKAPKFPPKVVRKQAFSQEFFPKPSAKGKDENKEYLLYRNTFLKLKGVFQPSPIPYIPKTPASKPSFRLPFPIESKAGQFVPHLSCPVVLRNMLSGKEGFICRCSTYSIPEVTDLEYDHLINKQLSFLDQIIIVYVCSDKEEDNTLKEVNKIHRKQNNTRNMPCIQSRLDPFRFFKYNINSASKFTGSNDPLLIQRHNVTPGIFLMYIQGKLLFANFIFNGYSTSAKDLHKQIVKTRGDYDMGYFLPSDFRIGDQPTSCFGNEDMLL